MTKYDLDPFEHQFITLTGECAATFSFNRSIGQLYGLLYISPKPLSLQQIASACHMSKGNASIHLRTLENWGAVRRSAQLGTRQDYFEAEKNVKSLALKRFKEGLTKRMNMIRDRISTLEATTRGIEKPQWRPEQIYWNERLVELKLLLDEVQKGMGLIPKLIQFKEWIS